MTMTMSEPMETDPMALVGFVVFDSDGSELGEVEGVYMGAEEPEWAALLLPTGQFAIVPLIEAEIYEDSIEVPFTAAEVASAPLLQAELLEDLTEDQEDLLSDHYSGASGALSDAVVDATTEVASTAKEQGRQVASTAVDHSQEVAATAKQEGQRVASTAKAQGQQVLRSTADQAGEIVVSAKQQAAEVADQASVQARNLLEETRDRIEEQTATGALRLGEQLQSLGEEALALSEGRPDEAPTLQGYVKRAANTLLESADRAYGLSDDIQTRGIGGVLSDVQTFARRRPGVFLLGAAGLGLVAGRAVRASKDDDGGSEEAPALPRRTASSRRAR
ncbi:MAG: hypothetical protein H0U41_05185 [Actinobacteria bacterium]|nr:hypothetical protein [Actinomycetota bacterium]